MIWFICGVAYVTVAMILLVMEMREVKSDARKWDYPVSIDHCDLTVRAFIWGLWLPFYLLGRLADELSERF